MIAFERKLESVYSVNGASGELWRCCGNLQPRGNGTLKRFFLGIFALTTFLLSSYGGPVESTYQPAQSYQPAEQWYRDHEWNFDLFGIYAFTAHDRAVGIDHAWGGGLDANFMFSRYLGIGVEGYGLAADDALGQASGNLIFRYPIPGSRLAPYAYAGGGALFNGSELDDLVDRRFRHFHHHDDTQGMGQFGAGIELRLTPNLGIINDFSWNVVNGDKNDFGVVRSGLRFAF